MKSGTNFKIIQLGGGKQDFHMLIIVEAWQLSITLFSLFCTVEMFHNIKYIERGRGGGPCTEES